jgi:hypothetical protein
MLMRDGRKADTADSLAARWEHDKNPEDFFRALEILRWRSVEFRLSVIVEQFPRDAGIFMRPDGVRRPHRPMGLSGQPGGI